MPKIINESCELVKLCHINRSGPVSIKTQCILLLLSYTKYIISINTKENQKEKQKNITQLQSLYAQMFYSLTDVIFANSILSDRTYVP